MNTQQRKEIITMISTLEGIMGDIETMKDEEQGKFDNLSDGLQASERGQVIENAAQELESAYSDISSVIDSLNNAIGG